MQSVSASNVTEAFEDLGLELDDPKVIDRLVSLCDLYRIDADKISTEYLAFVYRKRYSASDAPSLEVLDEYERDVLKSIEETREKNAKKGIVDVTNLLVDERAEDAEDDMLKSYNVIRTPKSSKTDGKRQVTPENTISAKRKMLATNLPFSPTSYPGTPETLTPNSRKYVNRKNAGQTVVTFGMNVKAAEWINSKNTITAKVKLYEGHKNLTSEYRFMFEQLREKADHLDEIICRLGDILIENNKLEMPQSFVQASPENIPCLGRIACDLADGRLNASSLVLQGTQDICFGRTVPLDPSRLNKYSFFPGQVIAGEASNPNGTTIFPSKVYWDASPPLAPLTHDRIKESPLSIVIASGPFTTSDSLVFEPLNDLLRIIEKTNPNVAIFIGPFLDEAHDVCKDENFEESFETVFEDRVLKPIIQATDGKITQVVIVPSYRDVHHLNIYPTPPFPKRFLNGDALPSNIHCVADPCVISIEGITFGLTSTDIIFHLGKEEISLLPQSGDRLRRMVSHILQQRSFYPLYPPNEEVNIDLERLEAHCTLKEQPHVLVLPSDLLHFFKEVNGGLVVNPSRLAKRESGGVYAKILVNSAKADTKVFTDRIQGEIVRI